MTDPRRPALFTTGIDASDVTGFFNRVVKPAAKRVAGAVAGTAIEVLRKEITDRTPDEIDKIINETAEELKAALKEALK